MKCIILGGTGFLGSNLIRELLCKGHQVICVTRPQSSLDNLLDVREQIQFWDFRTMSVEALKKEKVDVAYNLACRYADGTSSDIEIIHANYVVPNEFMFYCIEASIQRFITIGTGLPDDFNLYAMTKRQFADIGRYYVLSHQDDSDAFCFCNVELERFFGEGEPDKRFVPAMIRRLLLGEDLLLTKGDQKRDFVYIADVLKVLIALGTIDLPAYMDLPLGSGEAPTVREVMEYLHTITNSASKLCFGAIEKRMNEPDSVADLSKLNGLGLTVDYSWKEGMNKVVEYYKK